MDISQKVAIVTGGASGIGRATAVALASRGASVVVADVDDVGGRETLRLIEAKGGRSTFLACDVRRIGDLENIFREAERAYGGVDIVHNNAGIVCGEPSWPDTPLERLADQCCINLAAEVLGTRLAVDYLGRRGGGAVVNTSSVAANAPMADDPAYAATKAAVVMFTQSCARLKETHNIRVNAILPGFVDTPILAKTGDGATPAAWLAPVLDLMTPMAPERIADAVVDLIEDDSAVAQARLVLDD